MIYSVRASFKFCLISFAFAFSALIIAGCGFEKPTADRSTASVTFSHVGFMNSCAGCHESKRPSPDPVTGAIHGSGQDCALCHQNAGVNWLPTTGYHNPLPTSCVSCHEKDRSTADAVPYFYLQTVGNYPHGNGGDCVNCHNPRDPSGAGVYADFKSQVAILLHDKTKWASQTPPVPANADCNYCHSALFPSQPIPLPGGGTTPQTHVTLPSGQTSSTYACAGCHQMGVAYADWKGLATGFTHNPTTTLACIACHGLTGTYRNDVPSASVPSPILNPSGAPVMMGHASSPGNGDCYACHTVVMANMGVKWSGALLHNPKVITPSTCISCHNGEAPATLTGSPVPMNHATAPGNGDCVTCHTSVAANIGKTWAGGILSHTGYNSSTDCASCHLGELPATTAWYPATPARKTTPGDFNHAATYGTQCATCHTTYAANIGVKWTAGYFAHPASWNSSTNCTPCHVDHGSGSTCLSCHGGSPFAWPTTTYNTTTKTYGGRWDQP